VVAFPNTSGHTERGQSVLELQDVIERAHGKKFKCPSPPSFLLSLSGSDQPAKSSRQQNRSFWFACLIPAKIQISRSGFFIRVSHDKTCSG
jgi:hypothetical protein